MLTRRTVSLLTQTQPERSRLRSHGFWWMRSRTSGSQRARRWREKDANPRSPVRESLFSNALINGSAADNELCDRRNDQVLDAAKFEQEDGANEAGFGASHQKTVGNKGGPMDFTSSTASGSLASLILRSGSRSKVQRACCSGMTGP